MNIDEIERPLPWGLHDAYLERMEVDWPAAKLVLDVRVMVTEHQEMDQRARLTVEGLVFVCLDPPDSDPAHGLNPVAPSGLRIDSGTGPANEECRARLPRAPAGCFLHWLYVEEWNRFIHICGRNAEFEWLEPVPMPSRSANRALFPGETIPLPRRTTT